VIRQRGDSWEVRVYAGADPATGKRRHLYGTAPNKRAANRLERDLQRQAARTTPADADVNHLLDRWLEVARHAPSTRYVTEVRLAKHVRPRLGDQRIAAMTTERLDDFYLALEREGLAPATVARLHGCLRAAFAQAVRWDWLERNPAVGCRLPEIPNPEPVSPAPEQVRELLRAAPDDLAAFLRVAAVTGMRRGEACALRRSDVDLDAGVVRKARAISQGEERQTKTGARYGLAVGPSTMVVLKNHLAVMDERAAEFGVELEPDCFVFSNELDCSKPWRPDSVTQRLRRLCDDLGLQRLRLKDLRDWMVTTLLESGQSVRTVAGRAGHARASTTFDHYAAWVPAADAAAADALDVLLDEVPTGRRRRR
jgi:integrase